MDTRKKTQPRQNKPAPAGKQADANAAAPERVVWKGSTQLSPLPAVLVTCGSGDKANVLTVAWTGILSSQPPRTYISVRPERHSHALLCAERSFVINMTTEALCRATDLCGIKSGRDTDKFALCGLKVTLSKEVAAPTLADSPAALECKVTDILKMGSHDVFIADIVAVTAQKSLLNAKDALDLDKAGLIAFAHGSYYALGKKLGSFGYSVRKKPTRKGR